VPQDSVPPLPFPENKPTDLTERIDEARPFSSFQGVAGNMTTALKKGPSDEHTFTYNPFFMISV
jgi:hypothetical protein